MTVILDLNDFISEEYHLSFAINGTPYKFAYGEATVDEMLKMIAEEEVTGAQIIDRRRKIVATFLKNHIQAGDPAQLERDLALVPFQSQREELDIATLFDTLLGRVKKNSPGGSPVRIAVQPGSPATSPS